MRFSIKRPMAAAALVAAVCVYFLCRYTKFSLLMLILLLLIFVFTIVFNSNIKLSVILLCLIVVTASFLVVQRKIDYLHKICGNRLECELLAVEDSVDFGNYSKVTVITTKDNIIPKNTKLSLMLYTYRTFSCGDVFNATVKLNGLADDEFRDLNYGNGIYVDCDIIEMSKTVSTNKFFSFIGKIRKGIIDINSNEFSTEISAFLIALTTGESRYLNDNFYNNVKEVGLSHALVVSGMHLAIIMGSVFRVTDKYFYNRFLRCIASIVAIIFITAVCGFTLSIIRASFMYAIASFAPLFKRQNDSLNSLGAAVVIILAASPYAILNVGFQLSVLATLSIVWVSPFYTRVLCRKLKLDNKFAEGIVMAFVSTVMASLFTMPISIKVFSAVTLISPISYMLVMYPINWALTLNIAALVLSGVPLLSKPLFLVAGLCSRYVYNSINELAKLPITTVKAGDIAYYFSIAAIAIIILLMYTYQYTERKRSEDCADNK